MHRYFVKEFKNNNESFILSNDNFHHAINVVKLNLKEKIVCIYDSSSFLCEIISIDKDNATARIINKIDNLVEPKTNITLVMALIREKNFDFVLQKSTELGVSKIVPIVLSRNVVSVPPNKIEQKLIRWTKICEDASEQSHRNLIPEVCQPVTKLDDLKKYLSDINIVAWEKEKQTSFKSIIRNQKYESVTILVGPEGGITDKEIDLLKNMNFNAVTLGERILKAETAPIFMLSSIVFEKECD